jgi:hypothetical protein
VADSEVFMKCEHDFAVREGTFQVEKNFHTEICVVMEMHDVRREFGEETLDLVREAGVLVGEFEPVEGAGCVDVFVGGIGLA